MWSLERWQKVNIRTNERTYILTYIRTGQTLYPLHNFVVRGDNKIKALFHQRYLKCECQSPGSNPQEAEGTYMYLYSCKLLKPPGEHPYENGNHTEKHIHLQLSTNHICLKQTWMYMHMYFIMNMPFRRITCSLHLDLPGRVAQSVGHLTCKSGVLGSIPGLATYFCFSFRFFKKASCQLLTKVCARSTGLLLRRSKPAQEKCG